MDEEAVKEIEQPKSLEDCFLLLNKNLVDKDLFKDILESNVGGMSHFTLGRWMRNYWYLWWSENLAKEYAQNNYPQEKPVIVKYFNETHGIFHADDMSAIIVTSYHRHLNGRDLKLDEQVKKYKDYWVENGKDEQNQ